MWENKNGNEEEKEKKRKEEEKENDSIGQTSCTEPHYIQSPLC